MGWKGTLRSINAELNRLSRASEKWQKQQSRANERKYKQQLKELEQEEASTILRDHELYLKEIVSFHHTCRTSFDWEAIKNEESPSKPENNKVLTKKIQQKIDGFKYNIFDKLPKVKNWRKNRLTKKLSLAKQVDEKNYKKQLTKYKEKMNQWNKKQMLSKRLDTEPKVLLDILQEYVKIDDIPVGESIEFSISNSSLLDISLKIFPFDKMIPKEDYSLRQSGMLSTKKMPKGKGVKIYQDYVCSAILRTARETFGAVPSDMIRVNALVNSLNTKTGHLEDHIILSVIIPRETLFNINFNNIDPSCSLDNFIHNMKIKKTKGFETVSKIEFPS